MDYSMNTLNNQVNKMKRKTNSNIDSNSCPPSKLSSATVTNAVDGLRSEMDRPKFEHAIQLHGNKIGEGFQSMKLAAFDKDAHLDSEMRPFNNAPNDQFREPVSGEKSCIKTFIQKSPTTLGCPIMM
ncbi:hypothetical protein CHUAL_004362 [Chamberlinius hualienensis]